MGSKLPNYSRQGKVEFTISAKEFTKKLEAAKGLSREYVGFVACLYYFGLRVSEVLGLTADCFRLDGRMLSVDVPKRLKHGKKTPPLTVRIDRPFVKEILITLRNTIRQNPKGRLWKFNRVTGWRIMVRVFGRYPHWLRLNRITNLFSPTPKRPSGHSIAGEGVYRINFRCFGLLHRFS